ncbi:hypothetical protein BOKEGFJH_00197 [Chlamydia avium]|uniref:Exported protein n=1 Tax=Chlamydia avium TaxID=1457141 RepID=A0ABP2X684_9CHLA|nr:CT253 family lipoprotein [Chlamydia avium]EPP37480.1 putative exported protein [Chlamydia psittaci 10_743_SC13]EPP38123.1 putative exported protein [Chlamydia avium]VVT42686.1 hypothetical protein BOKEGFJH_00197 [Chlamydia avium]
MRKLLLLVSLGLLSVNLSSCSLPASGSYHPKLYTSGSKAKGVVAMLPVFYRSDKVSEALPWNLQTEFTQEISKRLHASDKLFLIKHNASPQTIAQFYSVVPQVSPETIASLLPAEFIVATELLEQKNTTDTFGNNSITASVRVRVFDIRHNKVSMIYQEIIESSQVNLAGANKDYHRYGWQTKHFEATPMGLMHNRLFREIVARVEGYVCANYS